MKTIFIIMAMVSMLWFGASSHADLIDRGNGLIYDSTGNVTWLQNATPAVGFVRADGVINGSGQMNWNDAMNWAGNLIYQGYEDWEIPSQGNFADIFNYGVRNAPDLFPPPFGFTSPFINLQYGYWTSDDLTDSDSPEYAWVVSSLNNFTRGPDLKYMEHYVWAVRPGDVVSAPVPEPSTMLLLGSGLVGLVGYGRRRLKK